MTVRARFPPSLRRALVACRRVAAAEARRGIRGAVAAAPHWIWRGIGPRLARVRPVDWYPEWSWAACERSDSLAYRARAHLWEASRSVAEPIRFEMPWVDNLLVEVTLGNDMSQCLFVAGSYEPNEFALLTQVLRDGMVFIDVGANEGLYTLFASRRVGPGGHVLALEPSAREHARLLANIERNRLSNVTALEVAAHREAGHGWLRIGEFGHEGHNTLGEFAYDTAEIRREKIRLETLDAIVHAASIERTDIVKIDAEGAEPAVLAGAEGLLREQRPLLLIEILDAALRGQGGSRRDIVEPLRAIGYAFWVFGKSGRPERVEQVEVDGANVLAVHPARPELARAVEAASQRTR